MHTTDAMNIVNLVVRIIEGLLYITGVHNTGNLYKVCADDFFL